MRAQILGVSNVARLVEAAGEIARFEHRAQYRRRIARIGAQIAVAQVGGRKQRRAAGKIDQYVAARLRIVARLAKRERVARGRAGRGVVVDGEIEGAEMALGLADVTAHDWEVGRTRRRHVGARLDQQRDVEMIFQQIGGFERALVFAVDRA